jgi:translation initiation factor IF-2
MTRLLLSTVASAFLLAAPVAAFAQTPAPATTAPATPAKPAAKPMAKPAPKVAAAKPAMKPMAKKVAMKPGPTKAGDAAVEKLNEQSLAKARSGT